MQSAKQEVSKLLDTLPENCSLEDIQYHLFVLQKVDLGIQDGNIGRTYTQEEMEKRMMKWLGK
jgi:predicted transcriptional regulator